jgi:hypothetical protein
MTSDRLALPLIGQDSEPSVEVTKADVAAALEAEDIERYGHRV